MLWKNGWRSTPPTNMIGFFKVVIMSRKYRRDAVSGVEMNMVPMDIVAESNSASVTSSLQGANLAVLKLM